MSPLDDVESTRAVGLARSFDGDGLCCLDGSSCGRCRM